MHPHFHLPGQKGFALSPTLPQVYKGQVLRGGNAITATGTLGQMVLQTFQQASFHIRLNLFDFVRPVRLPADQPASSLVSLLALKNDIHYSIKGLGTLQLKPGQFALLHCREHTLTARFEKDKTYQSLEIEWSEDILRQAFPYFDLLQPVLSPLPGTKSFYLVPPGRLAGPKTLALVQEMLKSPYDDALSRLFFEHKVREYLLLLLVEAGKKPASRIRLSTEEWEKVHAVATLVTQEPAKKFPIANLAANALMNSMKLKMAFKEKFGQGIFEYQLEARMKEGLRLLQETDLTTKDVAGIVGYQRTTSFITKFGEYFGFPPSQVSKIK